MTTSKKSLTRYANEQVVFILEDMDAICATWITLFYQVLALSVVIMWLCVYGIRIRMGTSFRLHTTQSVIT